MSKELCTSDVFLSRRKRIYECIIYIIHFEYTCDLLCIRKQINNDGVHGY